MSSAAGNRQRDQQQQLEIKFRLTDGTDIGPRTFPVTSSVSTLKECILSLWPKDKENGPKTVKDVKLISGGRVLENNRKVGDCRSPLGGDNNISGTVTTMLVLIQPRIEKEKTVVCHRMSQNKCTCAIL